jgi:hypothetical protein
MVVMRSESDFKLLTLLSPWDLESSALDIRVLAPVFLSSAGLFLPFEDLLPALGTLAIRVVVDLPLPVVDLLLPTVGLLLLLTDGLLLPTVGLLLLLLAGALAIRVGEALLAGLLPLFVLLLPPLAIFGLPFNDYFT